MVKAFGLLAGRLRDNGHDHQQNRQTSQQKIQCHVQRLLSDGFLNVLLI